jgi:hypothetical protein
MSSGTVRASSVTARESERYFLLVETLLGELQPQGLVASALGVSQSYVSKIGRGWRTSRIAERTVAEAARRLGLPREFFSSDVPVELWREHAKIPSAIAAAPQADPAAPSVYDLVRRMDERELRAFRAWVNAWAEGSGSP